MNKGSVILGLSYNGNYNGFANHKLGFDSL
jgi:hypothetical protein